MKRTIRVSDSFSKRQLDLECLQSMSSPSDAYVEVAPSVTFDTPKIVSGPQKLVQRYAVLFTTITGSDRLRSDDGTRLYGVVFTGNVGSVAEIELMAHSANAFAKERIQDDDADSESFGQQPDDEKLDDCWIDRVVVDTFTRNIKIFATIRTVAGNMITFIVPTVAGIY